MNVTSQLFHSDPVINKPFLKTANNFWYERFHRSYVDNFKAFKIECTVLASLLAQYLKNWKHRDVGLAGTRGSTH